MTDQNHETCGWCGETLETCTRCRECGSHGSIVDGVCGVCLPGAYLVDRSGEHRVTSHEHGDGTHLHFDSQFGTLCDWCNAEQGDERAAYADAIGEALEPADETTVHVPLDASTALEILRALDQACGTGYVEGETRAVLLGTLGAIRDGVIAAGVDVPAYVYLKAVR
ncbi:MAG TPA: hypothetical protein VFF43_08400 [Caldimonas sp.]|nr:hypothetical protein [Caldimonas sp.]